MSNVLVDWLEAFGPGLTEQGYRIGEINRGAQGSVSIQIDSKSVVGTICWWPEDTVEFQFNSCSTGEVLVIVTETISTTDKLNAFFIKLELEKL